MNIEEFRQALLARQGEAARGARARLRGAAYDESRLDELDADLFSLDETVRAAGELLALEPENRALASGRSRLAILLDEGPLARSRPLDREIEAALDRGRLEEALELGAERLRVLSEEGARTLASPPPSARERGAGRTDDGPPASGAPSADPLAADRGPQTLRSLGALVRGESASALVRDARVLLAESAPFAEQIAGWGMGTGSKPRGGVAGARDTRPDRFAGSLERRIDGVLESWCGPSPRLPFASIAPALRELGSDLGIDPRAEIEIVSVAPRPARSDREGSDGTAVPAPRVLEEDPPSEIVLCLPERDGLDALLAALSAWGIAAAGHMRSATLPEEHRLRADRALGAAAGAVMATLAPEHAFWRREPVPARRRTLARALVSARVAAALFLERDRVLSGEAHGGDRETEAIAEASLGRARPSGTPPAPREAVFAAADMLRGLLLAPHLRERLRTRFGNLWYRERGAGRFLREACEPGGSLTIAEIRAGFSLPAPTAESLMDSWRDEIKGLR